MNFAPSSFCAEAGASPVASSAPFTYVTAYVTGGCTSSSPQAVIANTETIISAKTAKNLTKPCFIFFLLLKFFRGNRVFCKSAFRSARNHGNYGGLRIEVDHRAILALVPFLRNGKQITGFRFFDISRLNGKRVSAFRIFQH